ncbi:MAG: class IIb bacteriocin, lactobin A/cerein 7B family [Bacilli bacterium]|jgi:lactobin A/cerein 7B family class IIb bacteriocin|nr:class IIb bacteriocin, lactobin A/cerein 7B family [Bacilli bacterium]
MYQLSNNELMNISGGLSLWGAMGIISGIIFIIGVIDGFVRPLKCHK